MGSGSRPCFEGVESAGTRRPRRRLLHGGSYFQRSCRCRLQAARSCGHCLLPHSAAAAPPSGRMQGRSAWELAEYARSRKPLRRAIGVAILNALSALGIEQHGPGGGIELGKSPEAITLWALVCATEGPADVNRCALGIGNCSANNPCPLHGRWVPLRDEFQKLLEGTTLAALLRELADGQSKHGSVGRLIAERSDPPSGDIAAERQVRR